MARALRMPQHRAVKTILEMEAIQARSRGRESGGFKTYFWITVFLGVVAPMLLGAGTALWTAPVRAALAAVQTALGH